MAAKMAVTFEDGTEAVVTAKPIDVVAWERHFHTSFITAQATLTYEQVLYLAFLACKRIGKISGSFEDFLPTVDGAEPVQEEMLPPPTPPA